MFKEKFNQLNSAVFDILKKIQNFYAKNAVEVSEFYKTHNPLISEPLSFAENLGLSREKFSSSQEKHANSLEKFGNSGFHSEDHLRTKLLKRNTEEPVQKFKIIEPLKSLEEKATKSRQEIPSKSETFLKSTPNEIINELNLIRSKVSELRGIERKVNSGSQRELGLSDYHKLWYVPTKTSNQSTIGRLSMNFYSKLKK